MTASPSAATDSIPSISEELFVRELNKMFEREFPRGKLLSPVSSVNWALNGEDH